MYVLNCFKYFQIYILGQMPQKNVKMTKYSQRFSNYIRCQND